MPESKFTCKTCGQHFETKSDLQDHEREEHGSGRGNETKTRTAGQSKEP
jgi:hypothetical protein